MAVGIAVRRRRRRFLPLSFRNVTRRRRSDATIPRGPDGEGDAAQLEDIEDLYPLLILNFNLEIRTGRARL